MGKKSRESNGASKESKPAKAPKSLVAVEAAVDPTLAALFASSAGPVQVPPKSRYEEAPPPSKKRAAVEQDEESDLEEDEEDEGDDQELSSVDGDLEDEGLDGLSDDDEESSDDGGAPLNPLEAAEDKAPRKRKRDNKEEDLEGKYLSKLAKEEEKEEAERKAERKLKRQKLLVEQGEQSSEDEDEEMADAEDADSDEEKPKTRQTPKDVPMHESLTVDKETSELEKAARTVFLANVSTNAITDKKAKKTLMDHMGSFIDDLPPPLDGSPKPKVESIRFRSTAYESTLPKKASFATKALMAATTKSTNAYVVYTSSFAAREAAKRLNSTVVLDRHLRVDGVAHPAKTDHRRCVFVGNLGFVDDESMMDEGDETQRKRSKIPSDIEEGLWRQFGKAGEVESVRVVRDEKTRVGKGFAYVQFKDANAVEAALLFNEKKFPPMLPRVLRVTRAKAMKKTANAQKRESAPRPTIKGPNNPNNVVIYNPKMSAQQQSLQGRAGKLLGRAGAAQFRKREEGGKSQERTGGVGQAVAAGIKGPEAFIFEGYRASSKSGKPKDLKLGGKNVKGKGRPKTRSSQRASDWKKTGGKKAPKP
ncbi:Nucleolar protein 12 [Pseudogymnoascus destructans]|uniref:Nucleolar protein 12 n=2 Tax=Pseudogymnoascus destructans TaxID=655981 RepID=L8FSS2_PSED2|nr:Nucleolar protein 12 [Pseudogymnoascus destructans]ELR02761.1 hypothetical protein GMDG_05705 [Pseudogymnoascus destructans 20631-21]OAF59074.1 Nucleolar protein 12 [Pseudogymnoascus destructans]